MQHQLFSAKTIFEIMLHSSPLR